VLEALASIATTPKFREEYRRSLKMKLGDDPKENEVKLVRRLQKDYAEEKVARYRELIKKAATSKLRRGALPWPICIPFGCCGDGE
jgi:hypothetical protein